MGKKIQILSLVNKLELQNTHYEQKIPKFENKIHQYTDFHKMVHYSLLKAQKEIKRIKLAASMISKYSSSSRRKIEILTQSKVYSLSSKTMIEENISTHRKVKENDSIMPKLVFILKNYIEISAKPQTTLNETKIQ